jgi:hypothetical protein
MGLHFSLLSFKSPILFFFLFGACASVGSAPEVRPEPSRRERAQLGAKYVREKLPRWQRRLALQDWRISVVSVPRTDLRQSTLGNIRWDADNKTAVIKVLDAADYQMPFDATLKDMELTIVHELIHLELSSLPRSEASHSDEEHAINHLAGALLESPSNY